MTKAAKITVLLVLVALLPLRALAAATIGFCAFAHKHGAAHLQVGDDHSISHSHGDASHSNPGKSSCNSCVEHCSSASFAAYTPVTAALDAGKLARPAFDAGTVVGFVPDQLDPPPVARQTLT
jgi:hypothetical protein